MNLTEHEDSEHENILRITRNCFENLTFKIRKTGNKKHARHLATLPPKDVNSDVELFTAHGS